MFAHLENTWMARNERYKLVLRDGGKGELYDVQADPAGENESVRQLSSSSLDG